MEIRDWGIIVWSREGGVEIEGGKGGLLCDRKREFIKICELFDLVRLVVF